VKRIMSSVRPLIGERESLVGEMMAVMVNTPL
jgi:hypothetical protein